MIMMLPPRSVRVPNPTQPPPKSPMNRPADDQEGSPRRGGSADDESGDGEEEEEREESSSSSSSEGSASSLRDEIRALTDDEAQVEWLDAARYDDLPVLRAIYRVRCRGGRDVRGDDGKDLSSSSSTWIGWVARDDQGNTALHRAAANGHTDVVRWLLRTHERQQRNKNHHKQPCIESGSVIGTAADFVMLPNESGNTSLHWAAANGQADVVRLLLSLGAGTRPKKEPRNVDDGTPCDEEGMSTNGPGSSSALNGEGADTFVIDVLRQNKFGRSILTEGFQSDNQDVIQAILEHPSASEERLIDGGGDPVGKSSGGASIHKDAVIVQEENETIPTSSIIQDLVFGGTLHENSVDEKEGDRSIPGNGMTSTDEISVKVREVAMATASNQIVADQECPEHDRTGLSVWSASIVAAHWMSTIDLTPHVTSGVVALELGAGCAVPSLVMAQRLTSLLAQRSATAELDSRHAVYASDWNAEVLDNIRHNFQINDLIDDADNCRCHAVRMDWNDPESWEPWSANSDDSNSDNNPVRKPSIIVGADLIYQTSMVDALVRVVMTLLDRDAEHARFYYVAPTAPRKGGQLLVRRLLEEFRLVNSMVAPPTLKRNPLKSQDDDECFLHFQELLTSDFRLYEFAWK